MSMRYGRVPQHPPTGPGQRRHGEQLEQPPRDGWPPTSPAGRPPNTHVENSLSGRPGASGGIPAATRAGRRKFCPCTRPSSWTSSRTDRLPLVCCLIAFILTFFVTRTIVRYIRSHADSDAPRKWWQPRNIGHGSTAHPPCGDRRDLGHGLRADDGDIGRGWWGTRIHRRFNLFRYRCGAGARRVRVDPAPVRRVLGRGRPHLGGCGVRRGRGGGPADPGLQPAVVLRHRDLA